MVHVAEDLQLLDGRPRYAFNVYLADGYVVDAATRWASRRILREVEGRSIAGHLITHAHCDHQGASAAIAHALDVPILAGQADVAALERGDVTGGRPHTLLTRVQQPLWRGPAVKVDRPLREGDAVGSFTVLETAGHCPGLISLWREADRTLICADVLFGRHPITGRPGLHEPPAAFTLDPALNRQSIRRIAALRPAVACFGHGPPWHDPDALERFAEALPDDR
jgi:glyoxylase-like metal-dependent hydrolase (beta-lactamase superfamily II)